MYFDFELIKRFVAFILQSIELFIGIHVTTLFIIIIGNMILPSLRTEGNQY